MDKMRNIGIITTLIFILFGFYCSVEVFKILNIKNVVIGHFYQEPEIVKINDFEYDITSLLFYSADNENQYFATVNTKPVSNFDSTKKYTVTINGIEAKAVDGNFDFINANFTNQFNSTLDEILLIDTLNIKINFYKEGTKILFITNGGAQAINLWSSYIQKNGFKLKIVEVNYLSELKADNLPTKYIYYYDIEGNLIDEYTEKLTLMNYPNIPLKNCATIDGVQYPLWRSKNNELISKDNLIYECTKYEDLHFYLFDYTYVMVDMKISENLMNEFSAYYTEWHDFYSDNLQQFYTTYNFARFEFTLNFINGETLNSAIWPMQGYLTRYAIPNELFLSGPKVVTDLSNIDFNEDNLYLNHTCYEDITYDVEINFQELAGVQYPLLEIKLFNKNEDINTLVWGAQSGYIFEEL